MLKAILGTFALMAGVMPALAAPQLVVPVATPADTPRLKAWSESVPVKFNREAMFSLAPGAVVELTLPNGMRQAYAFDESIDYGGGIRSWVGRSTQVGNGERAIITEGPGAVWGWMHTPWGEYRIYPGKDNEWLAFQPATVDVPAIPGGDAVPVRDDPPRVAPFKGVPTLAPTLVQQKAAMRSKATPAPVFTLDLMILYTTDLAEKLGPAIMPMLYNFVTTSNRTFADSEVALNVRLVYTTRIDLPNSVGSGFALEGMAGSLSEAATFQSFTWGLNSLRNQVGADVVVLARDNPAESTFVAGIAKLLRNPTLYPAVSVAQSDAYSVLTNCSIGCDGVFVHEMGHNLGLNHDRATVARDFGIPVRTDLGVFPYAFGHYQCQNGLTCNPLVAGGCANQIPACASPQPNDFGTVMSYVGPRAFRYSNPLVRCLPTGGTAPGGFCGVADLNDNARAMNETRQNASAYRNAIPALASLPGSIQFTKAVYTGTESGGALTFTVSRVGGSNGGVSVNFLTGNGTATAGTDYGALAGILSWTNGDAADKTFTIVVTNDLVAEGIESIIATLSNPAGAFGVHLGYPTTAVGLIVEPWPPAGLPPTGFTSVSTPSAPWDVALDSFDPAGGDVVSFKSGTLPLNATGTSTTSFTGSFVKGTIAFAYRVSSLPFAGGLQFYVDGVLAFSEAGDTGLWKAAAIPVTGGTHTIEWRVNKVLTFPCRNAGGPNGEAYPTCQDRAWIDTVSLPLKPSPRVALSVARTGTGTGTVASSPSGISCGDTCSGNFDSGSFVILTPTAATGSVFAGWSGSCTGTATCTVTMDAAKSVTATFTAGTSFDANVRSVVSGYYQTILGRAADQAGLDFWAAEAARVKGLGADVREVFFAMSMAFFSSSEYTGRNTTDTQFITDLYRTFFNRTPDASGLAYWQGELSASGSRSAFLNSFLFSAEFSNQMTALFGTTSVRPEVTLAIDLFRGVFGRLPDSAGFNYWLGRIRTAQCQGAAAVTAEVNNIAGQFFNSAEYLGRSRSDREFVGDVYNSYLRRGPGGDSAGFGFWVGQLSSQTRDQVRAAFVPSAEFQSRVSAVVAAGCL